jgi:hypothetical protein
VRNQHFLVRIFFVFFLGGCGHLPEMPEDVLTTTTVAQHIKCEFRDAIVAHPRELAFLQEWNSDFTLTLETDEKGSVGASGSVTHPLIPTVFSLPGTLDLSRAVRRMEKIYFQESVTATVDDAGKIQCPGKDPLWPLLGKLGFADLFLRAKHASDGASLATNQLDYTLDFTIVKTATLSPKWTLIPIGGKSVAEAGFKLTGNRELGHTLTLTMKPKLHPCPLFPTFFKNYHKCPTVYATMREVQQANPLRPRKEKSSKKGVRPFVYDEQAPIVGRRIPSPTKKGVTPQESIDLEAGSARGALQNLDRRIQRLDRE